MIKRDAFIAELKKMIGWGYVLGGQGELYSMGLAMQWGKARQGGKDMAYFCETAARWFGHKVVDCSGLIIQAIRTVDPMYDDQTADGLYKRCKNGGHISCLPETPGVCVHKPGHIGVYLGDGKVIESKGVAYGVRITDIDSQPWTGWGELADVDYTEATFHITKILKKGMDNKEVIYISRALTAAGYSMRGDTSIFDDALKADVKKFQKAKRLTEDGIVGKQTTEALGGIWDKK